MSYETIPVEMKDSGTVHVLTGTVTDTGDGVATIDIDDHGSVIDVPVFYHCPESEIANGMPFSVDDRVVVVNSGDGGSPSVANMKVVGFEDGLPKRCLWEPWNTDPDDQYNLATTNPWAIYYISPGRQPWTIVDGFLDYNFVVHPTLWSSDKLVWDAEARRTDPDERIPIPKQELYFNIVSTVEGASLTRWGYSYLYLEDENKNSLFVVFSDTRPGRRDWSSSTCEGILIGDNDGKTPIDISCLSGHIVWLAIEARFDRDMTAYHHSDFIHFR